ncbi:MAG TPA: ECF transporter S component [candidate division Zixibacteria bacterium]|nr:ECF transporter S component [candidate division Zixibacteria bacterium]MDM7973476.1 ECF transporter S component [candidate division Zixibacteria bacterium]HOD67175.1 ECF transporter S component [candidate division Zixibacteria bacterium]HPM36796.1 ECF transporter S component [candidate division Zixibacteria bacterium]
MAHSALYLALAVLLPIGFHALGVAGRIFLPMHFPILLAGFLAGPAAGVVVGLLAPGLSHLLTGMPPTYAVPLMSLELPMYGLAAGIAYRRLHLNIYIALVAAMIVGRLMFGLGLLVLGLFMNLPYNAAQFFSAGGAIVTGLPGMAVQILLIPLIVAAVRRERTRPAPGEAAAAPDKP